MNMDIQKKAQWFHSLNTVSEPHNIVFVGSTFMHDFPIHELEHNFQLEAPVYNRGIENLRIQDLKKILDFCVFELAPSKVFINIGETDVLDASFSESQFISDYVQILSAIKKQSPSCKIYVLGLLPLCKHYKKINKLLCKTVRSVNCEFLDFEHILLDENATVKECYASENDEVTPSGYVAILRDLKMFFRNRMMGFGEVWNMVENWS